MSNWVEFLPLLLLVVIFWFLIVRPARARQRAFLKTQSELSAGDKVMLASGIYGEIVTISDDTVELRIAPTTVVRVKRQAIAQVERTPDVTPELDVADSGATDSDVPDVPDSRDSEH